MRDVERVHHVVAGLLVDRDRVLLAHRSPTRRWYPDVWDLPGGHVQDGEDERAALARELAEELGVRLQRVGGRPLLRIEDPADGVRLGIWVVDRWTGDPVNLAPDEHDELRWVREADLGGLALAHPSYSEIFGFLQRWRAVGAPATPGSSGS